MRNLQKALWLLRKGHYRPLLRRVRRLAWSEAFAAGLEYDPRVPITARVPRAPVHVRPIEPKDVPAFTSLPPAASSRVEALTRASARNLLESGLRTCYVGVTDDGPVYMQFLVTAAENERLAAVYEGLFPPLAEHEGLLEFAFTLQQYRARPVMPAVLLRLVEIARERGLERVVTYVRVDNPSLMRFFLRLSFAPFAIRVERWRFFRRRVEFRPLEPSAAQELVGARDVEAFAAARLR
jgi:GNAT superfamily N-acetyltransferase